jgi:hypothetical protein
VAAVGASTVQISQVAGTLCFAAIACEIDGASAFISIAKHAIQRVQRQLVELLRMMRIIS